MSIINVSFSIQEAKQLLSYIHELEAELGQGGSYPEIYTKLRQRVKEARYNEESLSLVGAKNNEEFQAYCEHVEMEELNMM